MAAIVKANASLTAGGLAVIRRSYSTTDDGTLNYEADYCCLSQFANNHIGKFRIGAQPPTAIPASMSQLRIDGTPKLYDLSTNTQNGLTYFNARYSSASLDGGEVIVTESTEQRNFSATVSGSITTAGNFGSTITVDGLVSVSFDYISTTVSVTAKTPQAFRGITDREGSVSSPFNKAIGLIYNQTTSVFGQWRESRIVTTNKTRSSRGLYTYTRASTGIYEAVNKEALSI